MNDSTTMTFPQQWPWNPVTFPYIPQTPIYTWTWSDTDPRVDDLEQEVRELRREIKEIKRRLRKNYGPMSIR